MAEETAVLGRMILRQRGLSFRTVTFATVQFRLFLAHVHLKEEVLFVERQSGGGLFRGIKENAENRQADQDKNDIDQQLFIFLIENNDLHERKLRLPGILMGHFQFSEIKHTGAQGHGEAFRYYC